MFYGSKTQNIDNIEITIRKYDMDEYSVLGRTEGNPKHQSCRHFDK